MKDWKEVKFSEVINIIGGGTPKTSIPEYWNGDIPWLSVSDFNNGRKYVYDAEKKITELGLQKSSTRILEKDQIIISARGTVGVVSMLGERMAFNQSNYGINGIEGVSNNHFLYYLLNDTVNIFISNSYGAVFNTITKRTFDQIDILLPPLPEQKAIAEVLSSLDDKIDLLHRQNETLEEMAQTLFRQWFVEEAEDSWEEVYLNDVLSVVGGSTPSTRNPNYWNGNINWTSPRDITNLNSIYLFDTPRKITEKGLMKISSGLLPKGTLLMTSRAPVGVLAFAEISLAINQGYIAIIDDKGFSKEFLYLWLKENMDYVRSFANGSTFLEISRSVFKTLRFTVPSKEKTERFQKNIKASFDKIKSNQIQIHTLEKLRDTLLPKLMSGEVRVKL